MGNPFRIAPNGSVLQRIGVEVVHARAMDLLAERRARSSAGGEWLIPATERRARPVVIPLVNPVFSPLEAEHAADPETAPAGERLGETAGTKQTHDLDSPA